MSEFVFKKVNRKRTSADEIQGYEVAAVEVRGGAAW